LSGAILNIELSGYDGMPLISISIAQVNRPAISKASLFVWSSIGHRNGVSAGMDGSTAAEQEPRDRGLICD